MRQERRAERWCWRASFATAWRGLLLLIGLLAFTGLAHVSAADNGAVQGAAPAIAPLRDYTDDNRPLGFRKDRSQEERKAQTPAEAETKNGDEAAVGAANDATTSPSATGATSKAGAGAGPFARSTRGESLAKDSPETLKSKSVGSSVGTVVFLVVVLGGMLAVGLMVMKKVMPGGRALFSTPALEILGRTHFDPQRYLALVRVGKRLLVVGVGPNGFSPVSEITDDAEAAELMAVAKPKTAAGKNLFQRMFQSQLANVEREAFLSEANPTTATGATAATPSAAKSAIAVGEFALPEAGEDIDQMRARMQAQIRSLRENES